MHDDPLTPSDPVSTPSDDVTTDPVSHPPVRGGGGDGVSDRLDGVTTSDGVIMDLVAECLASLLLWYSALEAERARAEARLALAAVALRSYIREVFGGE